MMTPLSKFCAIFEGVHLNPGYARGCGNEIKYILKVNTLAMDIDSQPPLVLLSIGLI